MKEKKERIRLQRTEALYKSLGFEACQGSGRRVISPELGILTIKHPQGEGYMELSSFLPPSFPITTSSSFCVGVQLAMDKLEPHCCPRPDPSMRLDLEPSSPRMLTCAKNLGRLL